MKTIRTTAALVLALAAPTAQTASAQPIPPANPYASCLAEASPHYGSTMTIDDLRDYMAEHPDCQNGGNESTRVHPQSSPPRSRGLTYDDVPAMVAAYKENDSLQTQLRRTPVFRPAEANASIERQRPHY